MQSLQIPLSKLEKGESGKVQQLNISSDLRRRLLDLGCIEGTLITYLQASPANDPIAYRIRGSVPALRKDVSDQIFIVKEESL